MEKSSKKNKSSFKYSYNYKKLNVTFFYVAISYIQNIKNNL